MGEIIVQAASDGMEAVPLLRSLGKQSSRLNVLTEEIIRLEEHSDELHDQGRKELFLHQTNAIAFLILTTPMGLGSALIENKHCGPIDLT